MYWDSLLYVSRNFQILTVISITIHKLTFISYSYKSDIWAFGCCLYEICTFKHAFDASSFQALAIKVLNGEYKKMKTYSKELRNFIRKNLIVVFKLFHLDSMLKVEPTDRPSILDLFQIPILRKKTV